MCDVSDHFGGGRGLLILDCIYGLGRDLRFGFCQFRSLFTAGFITSSSRIVNLMVYPSGCRLHVDELPVPQLADVQGDHQIREGPDL